MATPASFFAQLQAFSGELEASVASSASGAASIKERGSVASGSLKGQAKSQAAWAALANEAEQLQAHVNAMTAALQAAPLSSLQSALGEQLALMQAQSAVVRRTIATANASKRTTRKLSVTSGSPAPPSHGADENNMALSNRSVTRSSVGSVVSTGTPMGSTKKAAATKPRKSVALGIKSSSRLSPKVSPSAPSAMSAKVTVARISPAKLAVALRRQSLEARKQREAEAALQAECKEDLEAVLEDQDQDQALDSSMAEETTSDVRPTNLSFSSPSFNSPPRYDSAFGPSATTSTSSASSSPQLISTPIHSHGSSIPVLTAWSTPAAATRQSASVSVDPPTPATPDFAVGTLSEATRRLLEARSSVSSSSTAVSSSSAVSPSAIPRPSASSANLIPMPGARTAAIDSPPTPELATVALARESHALRAAKKAGTASGIPLGLATPMTARKQQGLPRESMGGATARTPGALAAALAAAATPSRNLFPPTTPMSTRARTATAARQQNLMTPAGSSALIGMPTTPAAELLAPLQFGLLAPAGSEDSELDGSSNQANMSLDNSLLATPELSTRFKPQSIAWVSGGITNASAKKPSAIPRSTPPKDSSSSSSAMPTTPAASSSALPMQTPRSQKKGILKTPSASVRKSSRLAGAAAATASTNGSTALFTIPSATKASPPVAEHQPMLQASQSDPSLDLAPRTPAAASASAHYSALDQATPATPATPMLLSSLSASFAPAAASSTDDAAPAPLNLTATLSALGAAHSAVPSSAAKRRAASAK